MIIKFEHRVNEGLFTNNFLNDVYVNMNNVCFFEVLRTKIKFYSQDKGYYWIPRTEYNIKKLNGYLDKLEK